MRDLELIQRNLHQRVVGDRTLRERIDDDLEVLERFGVARALQERHAAVVLATSELLGILRRRRDGHRDGEARGERL